MDPSGPRPNLDPDPNLIRCRFGSDKQPSPRHADEASHAKSKGKQVAEEEGAPVLQEGQSSHIGEEAEEEREISEEDTLNST
ncbi:hypothetical protein Drorol1_Dr00009041 [Drosera rotundifolia]